MIIRNKLSVEISQLYAQRLQSTTGSEYKPIAAAGGKDDQDHVDISPEALALQKSVKAALAVDDVRWDKVESLRQQIEQGTYEIPVAELTQRLLAKD